MEPLEIGDRVVRADGENTTIGIVIETGVDCSKGPVGVIVGGQGWSNSIWIQPFIIKFDFNIGDLVLPINHVLNHGYYGVVTLIERNGIMHVSDWEKPERNRYWLGQYTPDFLKKTGNSVHVPGHDSAHISNKMLELYLGK